jgi:16S rRNA (guanine966-N2)-methyltransferase
VRIVAGARKGARIVAPAGARTRPTSDRVREALFSILGDVEGARVLDLYAGSGALGLEALSRGAASGVFVERDRAALEAIERNVSKLDLPGASVVRADAGRFLAGERETYDLVFLDPPYEVVESLRMPLATHLPRILSPSGRAVLETAAAVELDLSPLEARTTRRYGSTRLTIYEAGEERA